MVAGASSWSTVGLVAGAAAGIVALATAAINHHTARLNRRTAAPAPADDPAPAPKALLPGRAHFINRSVELGDAVARIRAGEAVVSIEGDVGIGKSAAATELAHRLQSAQPAAVGVPDLHDRWFLWVDGRDGCPSLADICRPLATLTGNVALSTVADADKLDVLRAHLASSRTVLVLDNLRLADDPDSQAVRELVRRMPDGSLVIASLNSPGALDGARVPLQELDRDDAVKLFQHEVERQGLRDPAVLSEDVAQRLMGVVGGNPGMISWFVRALSHSSQSLEERLTALERGEGFAELLAPVWAQLAGTSQRVLGAIALLRGRATAHQLAIACNLPDDEVLSALDELMRSGFATPVRALDAPDLFTCGPAVERFAFAQTTAEERGRFVQRLARHYTSWFESDWEDARGGIPHVDAIRTVIEELFAAGDDDALQALFRVTLDILFTLGLYDDRIATGALAYESAMRAGNYEAASLASSVLSSTHAVRGELAQANAALALGLLAAEQTGSRREVARQMRETGFLSYRSREPQRALQAVERAEQLARESGDLNNAVDVLGLRMAAHWYLGELDEAERAADAYWQTCAEIPWERAKCTPLRYYAEIAIQRGDLARAQAELSRAREIAASYDDLRGLVRMDLTEARLQLALR
ncbi:MAG TPA: ATP-binding protein, partial [Conexibacter sp.]|nr:ATP-binding protein [Conexibacter sp.]